MNWEKKLQLKAKGWSDVEIRHAESALERAEQRDVHFSKIVFWSALVVIIFANLLVSLVLIPFLIVLNQWVLYSIVILLAGTVGFLYNFLITDIGHLEKKHHVMAGVLVPLLALANLVLMVIFANRFITNLQVQNKLHNPWVVGIVFAVAFIVPYVFDNVIRKLRRSEESVIV